MHCGWGKDEILKQYTFSQLERYCETIRDLKRQELADYTEATLVATATANGGYKQKQYNEYVTSLKKSGHKKVDVGETLKDMKKQGFQVEEN